MKIYVDKNALQDYTTKLIAKEKTIFATKDQVGSPLVASTVSEMTDHDKIYVYVGSETGYTSGNWYYWDGSAWTSGGIYNSEGFVLDDTLTSATLPAQAKAVGDKVNQLSEEIQTPINILEALQNEGTYTLDSSNFESGSWSYSTKSPNSKRLRTKYLFPVKVGMKIDYSTPTLDIYIGTLTTKTSSQYAQSGSWINAGSTGTVKIVNEGFLVIILRSHTPQGGTAPDITISDFDATISIVSPSHLHGIGFYAHSTTFSVTDMPTNSYTNFVVPTDTLTEAPEGIKNGGWALYRINASSTSGIDVVYLSKLATPYENYFGTIVASKNPAFQGWTRFAAGSETENIPYYEYIANGRYNLLSTDIEQGRWSYTQKEDRTNQIRTNRLFPVKKGMRVLYENPTLEMYIGVAESIDGTWSQNSGWISTGTNPRTFRVLYDGYMGIIFQRSDSEDITPSDYDCDIKILSESDSQGFSLFSHDTSFSILKMPPNSYTNFVVPTDTLTEAPANIQSGGWAIYRINASATSGLDIVYLSKLAPPFEIYYSTIVASRSPSFQNWKKIGFDDDITDVRHTAETGNMNLPADVTVEQGRWSYTQKTDRTDQIRLSQLISVKNGDVVRFKNPTLEIYIGLAETTSSSTFIQTYGWENPGNYDHYFQIQHDGYIAVIMQATDGSDITPADYDCEISIDTNYSRIADVFPSLNRLTCKIFQKVVCCGDSYTEGFINLHGDPPYVMDTNYSWVHYMSTLTGEDWENCGASGANTATWQTEGSAHYSRGLGKAISLGRSQAYVIGLGINDSNPDTTSQYHVDLGTASDIGTNANTYYGNLSRIIRELNAISPKAKIFVNTMPNLGADRWDPYNDAIRTIVETYKNTYPVHLIDLRKNLWFYRNASLTGDSINGHYTAIGYEQFSEIYAYILSDYINTHIADFQDVCEIPFDTN